MGRDAQGFWHNALAQPDGHGRPIGTFLSQLLNDSLRAPSERTVNIHVNIDGALGVHQTAKNRKAAPTAVPSESVGGIDVWPSFFKLSHLIFLRQSKKGAVHKKDNDMSLILSPSDDCLQSLL